MGILIGWMLVEFVIVTLIASTKDKEKIWPLTYCFLVGVCFLMILWIGIAGTI